MSNQTPTMSNVTGLNIGKNKLMMWLMMIVIVKWMRCLTKLQVSWYPRAEVESGERAYTSVGKMIMMITDMMTMIA